LPWTHGPSRVLQILLPADAEPVGVFGVVRPNRENVSVFVLKADISERHYLENWNEQLMLVRDVHIVQGPQGPIPNLVGSDDIDDEVPQRNGGPVIGKFLLFQSAIYGTYKFLPLIANWKMSMEVGLPCKFLENSVVEEIERTSQVVQGVSDDKGSRSGGKVSEECDTDTIPSLLLLHANGVEIRRGKLGQELIQVSDVLHGPFNLFP
jgi:hypothetical protein